MRKATDYMTYAEGMKMFEDFQARKYRVRLVKHDKATHIYLNNHYLDSFNNKQD